MKRNVKARAAAICGTLAVILCSGVRPVVAQMMPAALPSLMATGMGLLKSQGKKGGGAQTLSQLTSKYRQKNPWALNHHIETPKTPFVLRAGAIIPATLITGINSQLPGMVLAQVAENVYDTATGNYVLIPQGAKLIGEYSTSVAYGHDRVMVVWKRITFPDGRTLDIGTMPGVDVSGKSGFVDQVNNHYLKTFGSAILLSTIAGGIAYGATAGSPQSSSAGGAPVSIQGEMAGQTGNVLGQEVSQVMNKSLDISPTVTIRPGYEFDVMVTKDITLKAPYANVYNVPGP